MSVLRVGLQSDIFEAGCWVYLEGWFWKVFREMLEGRNAFMEYGFHFIWKYEREYLQTPFHIESSFQVLEKRGIILQEGQVPNREEISDARGENTYDVLEGKWIGSSLIRIYVDY